MTFLIAEEHMMLDVKFSFHFLIDDTNETTELSNVYKLEKIIYVILRKSYLCCLVFEDSPFCASGRLTLIC